MCQGEVLYDFSVWFLQTRDIFTSWQRHNGPKNRIFMVQARKIFLISYFLLRRRSGDDYRG